MITFWIAYPIVHMWYLSHWKILYCFFFGLGLQYYPSAMFLLMQLYRHFLKFSSSIIAWSLFLTDPALSVTILVLNVVSLSISFVIATLIRSSVLN